MKHLVRRRKPVALRSRSKKRLLLAADKRPQTSSPKLARFGVRRGLTPTTDPASAKRPTPGAGRTKLLDDLGNRDNLLSTAFWTLNAQRFHSHFGPFT